MIKCNLAVLLAERNLKMSDIIKETGLAKNTIRSLYYNEAKGVQFDTLERICEYLNVEPQDVILKINFKYEIISKNIDNEHGTINYKISFVYGEKEYIDTVEVSLSAPDFYVLFENEFSCHELAIDISYEKELRQNIFSQITELESEKINAKLIEDFIDTFNLEQHTVNFLHVYASGILV